MVSIETCRNLLNVGGYKDLTNEEIRSIRDFLYMIGQCQIDNESEC